MYISLISVCNASNKVSMIADGGKDRVEGETETNMATERDRGGLLLQQLLLLPPVFSEMKKRTARRAIKMSEPLPGGLNHSDHLPPQAQE